MGDCRLCGSTDVKLANSHIIPRSLYGETIRCEEGPARIVTNKEGVHPKRAPMGAYDPDLLCIYCEASFSDWDNYANELLMNTEPEPDFPMDGKAMAGKYPEVDQHKLLMFFISLIWRMQVTDHEMFQGMKLGPYEQNARDAIKANDPGFFSELDVVISKFDSELAEAFMGPSKLRIEGVNGYRVGFARHLCWVKIDKRPFPQPFNLMAISHGNPLHILYREFDGSPEKRAMIETVKGMH